MSRSFHWEPVVTVQETGMLYSVAAHLAHALNYSDAGDLDGLLLLSHHVPVVRAIAYSLDDVDDRHVVEALLAALDKGPVRIVVTP